MEISPFKIFNIYAHEDRLFLEALKKHVSILIRKKIIEFWYDAEIIAGQNWDETIKKNLAQADIILVFVSADFISSEYIQTVELEKALKRHHSGESVVVPIIARSCSWYHEEELTKLEALPEKAKPIKSWQDPDEAYENISNGLQRLIETLR
ncbi:MAG TPA: toll/interleukin-1 receptor domain-containing protein [Saprospiraceae bacterium]|nr:toll/interleukin-1 receptor domain-containing protein [Saprospiraceae bacterium]